MAIFGSIAEMPMPDALSSVGRKTGRFKVWNTPSQATYELHVVEGTLAAMFVNREPMLEVFPLRAHMVDLLNLPAGEFEFERASIRALYTHHQFPLRTLMLAGMGAVSELEDTRAQLPEARTVFRLRSNEEPWLTGELLEFWQASQPLLAGTASGEAIARATRLPLEQVLLSLYKLRLAGHILPLRAFEHHRYARHGQVGRPAAEQSLPVAPESGLLSKIMSRLRWVFSEQA